MKNLFCLFVVMFAAMGLYAQTTPVVMPIEEGDIINEIFGKNKDALMQDYLRISPVEARSFHEALFDYETEKQPWQAERLSLLRMYNEEFSSLDEKKLNSLTKQIMANDMEYSHLQMRYFRRMNKLLGATRAAKFFQLDSYFEQSTKSYIQNNLPFIKELEADRQVYFRDKPVSSR
ncbi:MAG: hypothetical protein JO154_04210 [Chitinophaga sp.]|uniref:hypothetical protein n=1 Tax=Chitinophaga sp. TaxID=1869181 RepID=UPI0025BA764F|nr:hypothetical protein [Chitinophaga sp.]MBV8251790.1 hypothetical protein [Chitinophaga sp.]